MTSQMPNPMAAPVDPSHLVSLGKDAVRLSKTAGISLTEAVVHTIGQEKLNAEQVRRVVEFANVDAFNSKFASMDPSSHRFVTLDDGPADPAQVLQNLNSETQVKVSEFQALEYTMPPTKSAAQDSSASGIFRTRAGAVGEVLALQSKLSSALEDMTGRADAASFKMQQAFNDLPAQIKRAEVNGASAGEIYAEWQMINQPLAKLAFEKLAGYVPEATKVAGRRINPSQPVVAQFEAFVKSAEEYKKVSEARKHVEAELVRVGSWLGTHGEQ